MNTLSKFFILLTMVIFWGCSTQFKLEEYYINHFPKESRNNILYYEESMRVPSEFKQYGAWKKEAHKYEGTIRLFVDSLAPKAEAVARYNDSCTIILPIRYLKNVDIGKPIIGECECNSVVLPSFKEAKEFLSLNLEDFYFYILEAERGMFLNEADLFDKQLMPNPWSHGFSKGFALNEKEKIVIFWIDIW